MANLASKTERAVRAYLIGQGKADMSNTYIANDSRDKVYPCRVIQVATINTIYVNREEGWAEVQIHHVMPANVEPGDVSTPQGMDTARLAMDAILKDTDDSMTVGDAQGYQATADAITDAGRALAFDPNGGTNPVTANLAANNADMLAFRCDELVLRGVDQTRGQDADARWNEIKHYYLAVSEATASN